MEMEAFVQELLNKVEVPSTYLAQMGAKIEELENEVSARVEKDGELEHKLSREREGQGVEAQLLLSWQGAGRQHRGAHRATRRA